MLDGGAVAGRLQPLSSFPFPCYIPLDHQRELSPVKDTVLELKNITDQLVHDLSGLKFGPPVTHVYQPLEYARASWDLYCSKYGQGNRRVILVGMNPGPFGMASSWCLLRSQSGQIGWKFLLLLIDRRTSIPSARSRVLNVNALKFQVPDCGVGPRKSSGLHRPFSRIFLLLTGASGNDGGIWQKSNSR